MNPEQLNQNNPESANDFVTQADTGVLGPVKTENLNPPEQKEGAEQQIKYSKTVVYFEDLLKGGDKELAKLREEKKGETDKKKVEKLNDSIVKIKRAYTGAVSFLKREDTKAAKKIIEEQIAQKKEEVKNAEDLEKDSSYQKLKELLAELEQKEAIQPKPTEQQKKADSAQEYRPQPPVSETTKTRPVVTGDLEKAETVAIVSPLEVTQEIKKPENEPKTESAKAEPKPEVKKPPLESWNELVAKQKEIIEKISTGGLGKQDGEKQKKEISWAMIKAGCEVTGKIFEKESVEIEAEKERQWVLSLQAQIGSPVEPKEAEKRYKEGEEKRLANDKDALSAGYDTIIIGSKLTDEQKRAVIKQGEISIGKRVILEKEDVAMCIRAGLDINNIKRGFLGLSNKITVKHTDKAIGEQTFQDINSLNRFIAEKKREYIKEQAGTASAERKKMIIEQSIEQNVLDTKIKEIYNSFPKISEGSKKTIEAFNGKVETQEQMIDALKMLQAEEDRYRKLAKKIDTGKRSKSKAKAFKALEVGRKKHQNIAKAMVELAETISGRNIYSEADKKVEKDFPNIKAVEKKRFAGQAVQAIIKEILEKNKSKAG